jgi:hypothetical protein
VLGQEIPKSFRTAITLVKQPPKLKALGIDEATVVKDRKKSNRSWRTRWMPSSIRMPNLPCPASLAFLDSLLAFLDFHWEEQRCLASATACLHP